MTKHPDHPRRRFALEIIQKLRAAGHEALWAGGCVRDQLLGREPKDYDVATSATPEQIRQLFGHHRTIAVGVAFGVITVVGRKAEGQVEVATFRQDAPYSDGRHPDYVTFSTAREDALRRDFTINGIFYDPVDDQVIDYVGGQEDLRRGVVRAIGNPEQRIAEDKLRMLRAVRFATIFDFELEQGTLEAVRRHAEQLRVVSAERIADEMRRMLVHHRRASAVQLLHRTGLLSVLLPEAARLQPHDLARQPSLAWQNTLAILDALKKPTFPMALAALLRELGESSEQSFAIAKSVAQRWKLTNKESAELYHLLQHEAMVRRAADLPWPKLQRLLIADYIRPLLRYAETVARVLDGHTAHAGYCWDKLRLPPEQLNPPPLVSGHDLQDIGLRPSPAFKRVLDTLRDAQLDGQITTKQEALEMARSLVGQ